MHIRRRDSGVKSMGRDYVNLTSERRIQRTFEEGTIANCIHKECYIHSLNYWCMQCIYVVMERDTLIFDYMYAIERVYRLLSLNPVSQS